MKAAHSIEILCRVVRVSRSGYYEWKGRPILSKPEYSKLKRDIEAHFKASRRTYGHRRIRECLLENKVRVGLKLTEQDDYPHATGIYHLNHHWTL